MKVGQIVFSKNGRDKNNAMVVLRCDDEYVYLVDGRLRTLTKPKKKKVKHIQLTHCIVNLTCGRCSSGEIGRDLQDADIRKFLKQFWEGR
jgi:ribosomal protein L14E/L6E/L27E